MQPFRFPSELRTVACLGAHPDDIEIGAGATISMLADAYPQAEFRFVILTGDDTRKGEALDSATRLLGNRVEVVVGDCDDGFVPYSNAAEAKRLVRSSAPASDVDLVLAPQVTDAHQDHRYLAEVAGQVFRDQLILGYEIVKYDGGLVSPNVYVQISEAQARGKARHLAESFISQADNHWYHEESFLGLMRIRGIECNAPEGYAEGFIASKIVF